MLELATKSNDTLITHLRNAQDAHGSIYLRDLQKTYANGYVATEDVTLHIPAGSFFTLLGPSGCGKTTLLRMIAGFEKPSAGDIFLNGQSIVDVPAFRRPINTVFQSYVLFPHLTVYQNVEFGLRMRAIKSAKRAHLVNAILESMQLGSFAQYMPAQLSGGQKQRVALARALINEPEVLLLDEPLSALDAKLRRELQVELLRLQKSLGTTFIFVTHDQSEAMIMSDHVGIMQQGRLRQVGQVHEVYERPKSVFVARFLGLPNILRQEDLGDWLKTSRPAHHVMMHPENIKFSVSISQREKHINLNGVIKERLYQGARTDYVVAIADHPDLLVADSSAGHRSRDVGSEVTLSISADDIVPLEG
ncbi:ABC transporter ATP-binding protein [Acidithiobacillus sp. AMEEHan]|uniref:ABC transporter ATP-binding protein n=1 Tax=Acidithiobacillus sp. AMEEHan TaxID=2994951 RepID=UPI0027E3DB57|nr:ABC transporter ATP-binding protein [Acidithiobacillus sp. AMEEHan]